MKDNNNMNQEDLAKQLDAKDQGVNTNVYQDQTANAEVDAMEAAVEKQGLGSVSMANFGPAVPEKSDNLLGWHELPLDSLPSGGRFYPEGTTIQIRSAKVAEIRHFSTMDENNLLDIDEKLNAIVESCTRVTNEKSRTSFKDLCEEDRFILILAIRDLTFPEPENSLKVDWSNRRGTKHEIEIKREYFEYFDIPAELEKYYSAEHKAFIIRTKSYGEIMMRPPSIGVMSEITKYIKDRRDKEQEIDQSLLQIAPFVATDWRTFNQKRLWELEVEMNGWDNKKYLLLYKLAEQMKIGIQPEMKVMVEDEEASIPINFRDGIKSLFIVQDLSQELL